MDKQFKKIFFVVCAVFLGAGIIFLAWKGGGVTETEIPVSEKNDEWRNTLSVVPQSNNSKILGASRGAITVGGTSERATTTTDLVARKLLLEYVAFQKNSATSTISDATAQSIANTLAQEIRLPQKREYTLNDLNISSDNSREANALYIKTVNALTNELLAVPEKETDLSILTNAVNRWDATALNKLKPKVAIYQKLIVDLLAVKTPSQVAPIHLHLVQSFETLRSSTVGLQRTISDPVVGIVALTEYRSWIDQITFTRQEYRNFFSNY